MNNEGDLTIVSAVAGADRRTVLVGTNQVQPIAEGETAGLFLNTTDNMYMSQERGKDMGYIRGNSINLSAGNNLGTEQVPLRIYTNGSALNLTGKNAYFSAVGNGAPLAINRYRLSNLNLKNPDRFIWQLDRSDTYYTDIYRFEQADWWPDSEYDLDRWEMMLEAEMDNGEQAEKMRENSYVNMEEDDSQLIIQQENDEIKITETKQS
jgi:hypothetical protein